MVEDISRKTIFVLVILTLLVSVLGMWTVLSNIPDSGTVVAPPGGQKSSGTVSLEVRDPAAQRDMATGNVLLRIESAEER